jgi:hypothetical protein
MASAAAGSPARKARAASMRSAAEDDTTVRITAISLVVGQFVDTGVRTNEA